MPHSFIPKQQSLFQTNFQSVLLPGQFLVICDFSENYSFLLQDAAQGFHRNNSQAAIHQFVAYYKGSGKFQHIIINYIKISDCLHYDTVAVHLFQKHLIEFLNKKFSREDKIFHFSNGSAAQYKNWKKFVIIIQILVYKLSGISMLHHMAKGLVMELVVRWNDYLTGS